MHYMIVYVNNNKEKNMVLNNVPLNFQISTRKRFQFTSGVPHFCLITEKVSLICKLQAGPWIQIFLKVVGFRHFYKAVFSISPTNLLYGLSHKYNFKINNNTLSANWFVRAIFYHSYTDRPLRRTWVLISRAYDRANTKM